MMLFLSNYIKETFHWDSFLIFSIYHWGLYITSCFISYSIIFLKSFSIIAFLKGPMLSALLYKFLINLLILEEINYPT